MIKLCMNVSGKLGRNLSIFYRTKRNYCFFLGYRHSQTAFPKWLSAEWSMIGRTTSKSERVAHTSEHQCCDDCLNALRNLFVHSTGFLESDSKGNKRYDKFA